MSILILGATGNTGQAIVSQLKATSKSFSIMTTDKNNAEKLALQSEQIKIGNYDDVASMVSAFHGIEKLYLVMPIHPKVIDWVTNVITAAKQAGVKHIVKQSGLKASKTAKSEVIRDHANTDQLIKDSGLDYTLIQPNTFFQNFYGNLPTINAEGQFYSALGETALSLVDINDVAAVAVAALTENGHTGKTHLITGAEALTSIEHAEILSQASGKTITYIDVPEAVIIDALKSAGLGDWLSEKIAEMLTWFTEGDYSQTTTTIENVLGRKPRSFANFATELAHSIDK